MGLAQPARQRTPQRLWAGEAAVHTSKWVTHLTQNPGVFNLGIWDSFLFLLMHLCVCVRFGERVERSILSGQQRLSWSMGMVDSCRNGSTKRELWTNSRALEVSQNPRQVRPAGQNGVFWNEDDDDDKDEDDEDEEVEDEDGIFQAFSSALMFWTNSVRRSNFSSFSRQHTVAPKHAVLILFVTSRYSDLPKQKAGFT